MNKHFKASQLRASHPIWDACSVIAERCGGGATVLKVGDKVCSRSEQKIFLTPTFWQVEETKYCLDSKSA